MCLDTHSLTCFFSITVAGIMSGQGALFASAEFANTRLKVGVQMLLLIDVYAS